jgi:hypothetical protein
MSRKRLRVSETFRGFGRFQSSEALRHSMGISIFKRTPQSHAYYLVPERILVLFSFFSLRCLPPILQLILQYELIPPYGRFKPTYFSLRRIPRYSTWKWNDAKYRTKCKTSILFITAFGIFQRLVASPHRTVKDKHAPWSAKNR